MTTPITCNIESISSFTDSVYRILLRPQTPMMFSAGQYCLIHMGEDDKRPFSIASAAHETDVIELHIGADKSNSYAYEVFEKLSDNKTIEVSGGVGDAFYRGSEPEHNTNLDNKTTILVAGGTGFSYTYSILKQALYLSQIHLSQNQTSTQHRQSAPSSEIVLYWGARNERDFYLVDVLRKLEKNHAHFTFIPVVEFPDENWKGRTGWVHKAVLDDYESLENTVVYIAGRFEMAKTARDDFSAIGLPKESLFGDAYAFL